jgi:hypothetical protein
MSPRKTIPKTEPASEDPQAALRARFQSAIDAFVEKVRPDPNVLAVIVAGSVAYDVIWEKSDVDMTVIVRDQNIKTTSYALVEDGITLNLWVSGRSEFRRELDRQVGGSWLHSYLAKGKVVYARDESLVEFFEAARNIGDEDRAMSAMTHATYLVHDMHKCRKWLGAGQDPLLAQFTLCMMAESLAHMYLCLQGEPATRQSIRKVVARAPELLKPLYQDPLSHRLTDAEIETGIRHVDAFLTAHQDFFCAPLLRFMADGEIKTVTLLARQFHMEAHVVTGLPDWLADKGVLERVSQTIRITPKGRQNMEELGYLYLGDEPPC